MATELLFIYSSSVDEGDIEMGGVIKFNHLLKRVEEFIIYSSIIIVATVLIANVIGRTFLQHSLTWAEELCTNIMIILTFVGTSYCARMSCHINMTAIYDILPFKLKKADQYIVGIVTSICLGLICFYAIMYIINLFRSGRYTPALHIPLWIVYLFIPYGLISTIIQYIITVYMNIKDKENVHIGVETVIDESVDMSDDAIAKEETQINETQEIGGNDK